jgi:hypothetical protein
MGKGKEEKKQRVGQQLKRKKSNWPNIKRAQAGTIGTSHRYESQV